MSNLFSFGGETREFIEIKVLGYERPISGDYHDDNWLVVSVRVRVRGFTGEFGATIMSYELASFLGELQYLYKTLKGTAEFTTLEEQIYLSLTCDNLGRIELKGRLVDHVGTGNRLSFTLNFDQTDLKRSLEELEKVTARFPVI